MQAVPSHLLKKRTFFPFFMTQFFGAFNDNAFKLAMLTLISYYLSQSQTQSENYQAVAGGLYILPFFIFSASAGQLADKFDKARMAQIIKIFEVVLMVIGGIALYFGQIMLMMVTLTGMGIHSSFFGPIKYSILPNLLPRYQLLAATALVEASTFLAILLGTTLGTVTVRGDGIGAIFAIILIIGAAIAGVLASFYIPEAPSSITDLKVDWNVWRSTKQILKQAIDNEKILPAILAISWFWLIGAVMLTKLPDYTHFVLRANTTIFALFLALFSVGIALGAMTINRFLAGRIILRYVPITMLLLSVFAWDLYWATPLENNEIPLQSVLTFFLHINHFRIAIDLLMFAFCGGLFVVPLYTYLQVISEDNMRSRTIAANNIFNALFMVAGSVLVMLLLRFHLLISQVFLVLALLNVLAAFGMWFLLYRIAKNGSEPTR